MVCASLDQVDGDPISQPRHNEFRERGERRRMISRRRQNCSSIGNEALLVFASFDVPKQPSVFERQRGTTRNFLGEGQVRRVVASSGRQKRHDAENPAARCQRSDDVRAESEAAGERRVARITGKLVDAVVRYVGHHDGLAASNRRPGERRPIDVWRIALREFVENVLQLWVGVRRTAANNTWTRPFIADNQIDDAPIGKARNSNARDTIGNDVEIERRCQRRREIVQQLLSRSGLFLRRDVMQNLRRADDATGAVSDGRNRQGYVESRAVLAKPDGLIVRDPLAPCEPLDYLWFFGVQLWGDDGQDRASNHLGLSVSKHALRGGVPTGDRSVERLGDDRVVAGLDDRRESCVRLGHRNARSGSGGRRLLDERWARELASRYVRSTHSARSRLVRSSAPGICLVNRTRHCMLCSARGRSPGRHDLA